MNRLGKLGPIAWAAVLLLVGTAQAQTISYDFILIADTAGPFSGLGAPIINNAGTVAFNANLDVGGGGIFIGSGGPVTTLYDAAGPLMNPSLSSINDAGTVAFSAFLGGDDFGIFTGNGGPTTTIAATAGPFLSFGGLSINNAGTVAFSAFLDAGGDGMFIFTGSGGPTTAIGGPFGGLSPPFINDAGTVAFFAVDLDGRNRGIFTGSGGPIATIADTSGPFSNFGLFGSVSINNAGTVAFGATLDAGGQGIFTGNGGATTTIADTNGPFRAFFSSSINNSGTVAFDAALVPIASRGIFTGPDPVADRVIGTGDTLFGSTVLGLFFDQEGLNDHGQIAFFARLADGRQVIVRADPQVIPEPSTLALLGIGTVGLLGYAWRRRNARPRPSVEPLPRTPIMG